MRVVYWLALGVSAWAQTSYVVQTIAGSDNVGDGGPALAAILVDPQGIVADGSGRIFIADAGDHRIRLITPDGKIRSVAGTGAPGLTGDGGPAELAQLRNPYGLAVDRAGNLYVADLGNRRVRKISSDGRISTVAGGGAVAAGPGGDGSAATAVALLAPRNVAVDAESALYISDFDAHRVYKVSAAGIITTLAGNGVKGYGGENVLATSASLAHPAGLAFDATGALCIAESGSRRIRRISGGMLSTFYGGAGISFLLYTPTGIAFDAAGNLYIADNQLVTVARGGSITSEAGSWREVAADPMGNVYAAGGFRVNRVREGRATVPAAGTGRAWYYGDGGAADRARLGPAPSVALGPFGDIYIADPLNCRVRAVDRAGTIRTVAGSGECGAASGDGGPAAEARFREPIAVAADRQGNLYVADAGAHRVRMVTPQGLIRTVAGNGTSGYQGDGGAAASAALASPSAVAIGANGTLYIADSANLRIRRVDPAGIISTVALAGGKVTAVAADRDDNVYFAEAELNRVRKLNTAGSVLIVPGANVVDPRGIAVDDAGNLYVSDTGSGRIRRIAPDGVVEIIAGLGEPGFSGDGGPALAARFWRPQGLAAGPAGEVFVADYNNHRVRKLIPTAAPLIAAPEPALRIVNAASLAGGPVAPGELIAISGFEFGPPEIELRFDGAPSQFLKPYVAQVPYSVEGQTGTLVELLHQGVVRASADLTVTAAALGLFTQEGGKGQVVAVHEDGTLNSVSNPAPRGSIVAVFATGEGRAEGKPVSVRAGDYPADILYAGPAPGLVGIFQVNFRVPAGYFPAGTFSLTLRVDAVTSQPGVTFAVR